MTAPLGVVRLADGSTCPVVKCIIEFESGQMSADDAVAFFQHLVDSGLAWSLQGSYGRLAKALIEAGVVSPGGRA